MHVTLQKKRAQRDFIFDFQSRDFESDRKAAGQVLSSYQKMWGLPEDAFVIGKPEILPMGWSSTKLFLSLELVQKLYDNNSYEIERSKGMILEDKFLSWLSAQLKNRECKALLKYGEEMIDYGYHGKATANIPRGFWQ